MATSYNGWPASSTPSRIGIVHFEPFPGYDFPGGIKGGDVKTIFDYLVRQLDARVEPIEHYPPGDEWGYTYKPSANSPSLLSCHSSGTAIDYNATKHPNGVRGTWTAGQVAEIRRILYELEGVVRWLYDATRTPDEMHFEIRGTATQVAAVARRIRLGSTPPTPPPPPPEEMFMATQFETLMERLNDLAAGIMIVQANLTEFDEDVPENTSPVLRELRVNQRTLLTAENERRKAEGKPLLKIVIGYDGDTPIYQ